MLQAICSKCFCINVANLIWSPTGLNSWVAPFHELHCTNWTSNRELRDRLPQVRWQYPAIHSPYHTIQWLSQPSSTMYHQSATVVLAQRPASKPQQVGSLFLWNESETSTSESFFIVNDCRLLHRRCEKLKTLRFTLDRTLNFNYHVNGIARSCNFHI